MGKTIFIAAMFFILALATMIDCKSISLHMDRGDLPKEDTSTERFGMERLIRDRRSVGRRGRSLTPGSLVLLKNRNATAIAAEVAESLPSNKLCIFKDAKPDEKTPCLTGPYQLTWSSVKDGTAADIVLYSETLSEVD